MYRVIDNGTIIFESNNMYTCMDFAVKVNRFYRDINNPDDIKYIEDGKEYYIKNVNSLKYMTVSGNNIVQDAFQENDSQRFKVLKNFDGSFTLTPSNSKKTLGIKWNWTSFRIDDLRLTYSLKPNLSIPVILIV